MTKKPRQEIQYIVEEQGVKYTWNVPLHNKKGEPNYLLERLMGIKEGEEVVLEMKRSGMNNYVDVRRISKPTDIVEAVQYGEENETEVPREN